MENPTPHRLPNTKLAGRVLWYDGDSAIEPSNLLRAIQQHDVRYVTERSPLVDEYNKHVSTAQEIKVKKQCNELTYDWTMPDQYKHLDVVDYLFQAHAILFEGIDSVEINARERRLAAELVRYEKNQLFDVLRAVIWIINTLTASNTVWGIGRGSSVSSYVLYVIGVHDVDSFAYELDIDDFLHE